MNLLVARTDRGGSEWYRASAQAASKVASGSALCCTIGLLGVSCGVRLPSDSVLANESASSSGSTAPLPMSAGTDEAENSGAPDCYDSRGQTPGTMDVSFGGPVSLPAFGGPPSNLSAFMELSDGKFLGAGNLASGGDAYVIMFDANGRVDPSFGQDGIVFFAFQTGAVPAQSHVFGAAVDSKSRILVAGTDNHDAVLARLTPDGALDPSFGTEGFVVMDQSDSTDDFVKVMPRPDGTIVVAGHSRHEANAMPTLTFLDEQGRTNSAIGNAGSIVMRLDDDDAFVTDIVELNDQLWFLLGQTLDDVYWASVDSVGALTATLGKERSGSVLRSGNVGANRLLREANGTIISLMSYGFGAVFTGVAAFDTAGEELWHTDQTSVQVGSIAVQCDGRIVVAGSRHPSRDIETPGALIRFESNGKVDTTFGGSEGLDVWRELPSSGHRISTSFRHLHIQGDGMIIAAGIANDRVDVARFWP